jgi:DNA-binding transcriptional regulator YdaS (Cro superfamily)
MDALDIAIDEVGGVGELAKVIGVSQPAVSNWKMRGRVPAEHCVRIEQAAHGRVTRYDLRPDIFGAPRTKAA